MGARDELYGDDLGPPTPQPELFSFYEEEPGGGRPGSVTDPVPQLRAERHIVEHKIEACPLVQILDASVPKGGNQLVEAFRDLDLRIPGLVIEVPKISFSPLSFSQAPSWCRRRNSWWKCLRSYPILHCTGLWS